MLNHNEILTDLIFTRINKDLLNTIAYSMNEDPQWLEYEVQQRLPNYQASSYQEDGEWYEEHNSYANIEILKSIIGRTIVIIQRQQNPSIHEIEDSEPIFIFKNDNDNYDGFSLPDDVDGILLLDNIKMALQNQQDVTYQPNTTDENSIEITLHEYDISARSIKQKQDQTKLNKVITAIDIFSAIWPSSILFIFSIIDLSMILAKDEHSEYAINPITLTLSLINLILTIPIAIVALAYMGLKQNALIIAAENLLNISVESFKNQQQLSTAAMTLIKDYYLIDITEHHLLESFMENNYRKAVKHPKFLNYLFMEGMSVSIFGFNISAALTNAFGYIYSPAALNFFGSMLLVVNTLYSSFFKIKDARDISSINNVLKNITEIIFFMGTDALLGITLALEGHFHDKQATIFEDTKLALLNNEEYPNGFLTLVQNARFKMLDICKIINRLAIQARDSNDVVLQNKLNILRKTTANLLKNHVILAERLTKMERNMPGSNPKHTTPKQLVAPLKPIIKKLQKGSAGDASSSTPLLNTQGSLTDTDIETIEQVLVGVHDRFEQVVQDVAQLQETVKEQDKIIKAQAQEIKELKEENAQQARKIEEQAQEIKELKAEVRYLRENIGDIVAQKMQEMFKQMTELSDSQRQQPSQSAPSRDRFFPPAETTPPEQPAAPTQHRLQNT